MGDHVDQDESVLCGDGTKAGRADGIIKSARTGYQARRDESERRSTQHEPVLHPESVDRWRVGGHCGKQSRVQLSGSVASDGDALGNKRTFQVSRNAASNLVS